MSGRKLGRGLLLGLRYLLAAFFTFAALNKWRQAYLTTDRLRDIFGQRLEEIDPESFGAWFIEHIGLPYFKPLAWMVCWGETFIALGLLFGFMTRSAALGAMLFMFMLTIGGYYDASLIVLTLMFLPFVLLPTGQWHGLDRRMLARYPGSIWFR
jgi:thiosulfate dehydrogenase [quinone] large subunit